jgi:hypothetical protein
MFRHDLKLIHTKDELSPLVRPTQTTRIGGFQTIRTHVGSSRAHRLPYSEATVWDLNQTLPPATIYRYESYDQTKKGIQ